MKREQKEQILKDLEKKIVFIVGPRQVGKTWLAKEIAKDFKKPVYLNYDRAEDRSIIKNESWLTSTDLLILDELHKMKGWKNYLKGVFDTKPEHMKILVTGSARLSTFKKSGDSLAGRFFSHTLLPFSPSELKDTEFSKDIERFMERGGFPEPFLAENINDSNRWRLQYVDGLIRNDILDFENVHDLKALETVLELLRGRVGSTVSYYSIANDVGIAPNTVKKYIQIFEAIFIVFRLTPFSKNIARSLMKEPKIYFYDTGLVDGDNGAKFENLVAVSLLKHVLAKKELEGIAWDLNYIRTKDKKEIDFCIVKNGDAKHFIEAKFSDPSVTPALAAFCEKFKVPATQVVFDLKRERKESNFEIISASSFLCDI
jgi:hypothetical protein